MSRMFERIEEGRVALGTFMLTSGPEMVEVMGAADLDAVCVDHMVTAIDWGLTADMFRAARQYDMTPWIRLQGYPWHGGAVDTRTVADVLRAIAVGAEGITISVDTPEQVEAILQPRSDQHRRIWARGGEFHTSHEADVLIFPMIESLGAARAIDRILDIEGLQGVFLGMGDLSRELGHPRDNEHPEVLEFVGQVVEKTEERGQMVIANTPYVSQPAEIANSVDILWNLGVKAVWIPYPSYLVRTVYLDTSRIVRANT